MSAEWPLVKAGQKGPRVKALQRPFRAHTCSLVDEERGSYVRSAAVIIQRCPSGSATVAA